MVEKRFNIFGTKYRIKFVDTIESEEDGRFIWGDTDSRTHVIRVATKGVDGKAIPDDEISITAYHELMHAIFSEGQYKNCNDDEPLVEWCARCLHSLEKQGII